jgi:hypothetical protein
MPVHLLPFVTPTGKFDLMIVPVRLPDGPSKETDLLKYAWPRLRTTSKGTPAARVAVGAAPWRGTEGVIVTVVPWKAAKTTNSLQKIP